MLHSIKYTLCRKVYFECEHLLFIYLFILEIRQGQPSQYSCEIVTLLVVRNKFSKLEILDYSTHYFYQYDAYEVVMAFWININTANT